MGILLNIFGLDYADAFLWKMCLPYIVYIFLFLKQIG